MSVTSIMTDHLLICGCLCVCQQPYYTELIDEFFPKKILDW